MKKEKLGFNIILLGQITSGKSTQAKHLSSKYSLSVIDTGKFSRKSVKKKSFEKTTGKGGPAPANEIKNFIKEQVEKVGGKKDILFLGGPRLKSEADFLYKLLKKTNQECRVIYLTLPDKEVYKRSIERMSDKKQKYLYKMLDSKNFVKTRIAWHKKEVGETVKYWKEKGNIAIVNGIGNVDEVRDKIEKAIANFVRKNKSLTNKQ